MIHIDSDVSLCDCGWLITAADPISVIHIYSDVSLCDCGWLITAADPISVIHIDSGVSLCDCGWLITAAGPISVIHIDADDDSDDADNATQLVSGDPQQTTVIDDCTNDSPVRCLLQQT